MLPESFLERMRQMLGEEYGQFLQSYDREECHALRINLLKVNKEIGKQHTKQQIEQQMSHLLTPILWNEDGFYYDKAERPGRHPYHDAGVYYIQEASAMAPVMYLAPKPGERILDLCAAPGGKSTQIASAMKNQGILVCNEIHPARAKILSENVERMGIQNGIVTNETPQRLQAAFGEYFDKILVDAPCSGEGMFRKNEEACSQWNLQNVQLCAERQDEILACAANMLAPGGRLVYSTCTFAPLENEGTISRFINSHPDFIIEPVEKYPGMKPGVEEWVEQFCHDVPCKGLSDTIRLWPHHLRGEGHYVAVLRKKAVSKEQEETKSYKSVVAQRGRKEKEYKEYMEFCDENIKEPLKGILVSFGEQLYLAPEHTPSIDKLRVLRLGLHLGTCKKNRFEPSHALALALQSENVKHTWNLSSDSNKIMEYLQGQTIQAEGEKGWYLITVDGFSIGWGKLTGTIMKNHYPKGLRKP